MSDDWREIAWRALRWYHAEACTPCGGDTRWWERSNHEARAKMQAMADFLCTAGEMRAGSTVGEALAQHFAPVASDGTLDKPCGNT
jgi:hypothetical protein